MDAVSFEQNSILQAATGADARRAIRSGAWTGHTSGTAPHYVQGNLVILPAALATDFFTLLSAQSETLSSVGSVGAGRSAIAAFGR